MTQYLVACDGVVVDVVQLGKYPTGNYTIPETLLAASYNFFTGFKVFGSLSLDVNPNPEQVPVTEPTIWAFFQQALEAATGIKVPDDLRPTGAYWDQRKGDTITVVHPNL